MLNIAHPVKRFLAYLIDFVIHLLTPLVVIYLLSQTNEVNVVLSTFIAAFAFLVFAYPLLMVFLTSFMISNFGGTFGKILTGTKIVNSQGEKLSFWKAFFRNHIGYMISGMFLWLGFIWIFVDKERRSWHDQICDTFVIVSNKWIVFLGAIILVGVGFLEAWMVGVAVNNFKENSVLYKDIATTIQSSLKESNLNKPISSPTPKPTLKY